MSNQSACLLVAFSQSQTGFYNSAFIRSCTTLNENINVYNKIEIL